MIPRALIVVMLAASATAAAQDQVDVGWQLYERAEFEAALEAFDEAEARGSLSLAQWVRLLEGRALVFFARDDRDAMGTTLARLARVAPDHELAPDAPPEIVRAFLEARAAVAAPLRLELDGEREGGGFRLRASLVGDRGDLVLSLRTHARPEGGEWTQSDDTLRIEGDAVEACRGAGSRGSAGADAWLRRRPASFRTTVTTFRTTVTALRSRGARAVGTESGSDPRHRRWRAGRSARRDVDRRARHARSRHSAQPAADRRMSAERIGRESWASELVEPTPAEVERNAQRFGRYLLCWELASGGMGTVYLARELGPAGFDRPVAIKRIHPHLRKQSHLVDMFLDEARITSRISHPNVCSVFDFGMAAAADEVDGTFYIALEYLLGESVGGIIAHVLDHRDELDTPIWQAMSARIIAQAAEGLHAAHHVSDASGKPMNVVHRDVSPPNLFVTYDGAVKVLDFGVARAEGRLHTTRAGIVKGKLSYMAPEQIGEKDLDGRADVWSLGVCLWEMLTGERLFRAKNEMDTILAVKSKTILRPSELRASIPAELDAIVMQALERDLSKRFASARELSRALETFLRSSEVPTGLADVAEWMDARFHTRRERKNEMVETVLRSAEKAPEAEASDEKSGHRISARAGEATPSMAPAPMRDGTATADLAPESPPSRSVAWKWAVPIVALLVGVGGTLLITRSQEPEREQEQVQEQAEEQAQEQVQTQTATPDPDPGSASASASPSESEAEAVADPDPHEAADLQFELEPESMMRAVRRAPGRVNVVTPGGWADVWFRGRRIGRTPGSFQLPAGPQRLELRPFGTGSVNVMVRIESSETVRVSRPVSR